MPSLLQILAAVTLFRVGQIGVSVDDACINCIGTVEGGGPGCRMDVGSLSCGKYQIKQAYWIDCGQPGAGWKECADNETCARGCVNSYLRRYAARCAVQLGKPVSSLTCYDYGRVHNGGPNGCSKAGTLAYVSLMKRLCSLGSPNI